LAPSVAFTTTLWLAGTAPVVAEKLALPWPAGIVTLPGTVTNPLLLISVTTVALAATWFSDTVHVLDELPPRVEGAQESDTSGAEVTKFSVLVSDAPPALAVRTTVSFVLTAGLAAVKLALVRPAAIITLAGIATLA
jgi:hypothetical protein